MPDESTLREEIDAEIADHLASAAARLERQGCLPSEAQRQAGERFGDVELVRRRLWWIHEGEKVMWRALGVSLLVIVSFGLIALAYGGWRMQRSMDDRLLQLTDQLEALNRTQRELLKREEPSAVLELTGHAYLGDPGKPADGASLQVCRLPNKSEEGVLTIRSLKADAQGLFRSGPLPPGDYYVLAKLLHDPAVKPDRPYSVQSRPQYLYPGVAKLEPIELDLQLHYGELVLESSRSMPLILKPQPEEGADERRDAAALVLQLRLSALDRATIPWTPIWPEPTQWPIIGASSSMPRVWRVSPQEFRETHTLAAGRYAVSVQIHPEFVSATRLQTVSDEQITRTILRGAERGERGFPENAVALELAVREGKTTRVRLEVPEDYDDQMQQLIDEDQYWFSASASRSKGRDERLEPRPLKLTILE